MYICSFERNRNLMEFSEIIQCKETKFPIHLYKRCYSNKNRIWPSCFFSVLCFVFGSYLLCKTIAKIPSLRKVLSSLFLYNKTCALVWLLRLAKSFFLFLNIMLSVLYCALEMCLYSNSVWYCCFIWSESFFFWITCV